MADRAVALLALTVPAREIRDAMGAGLREVRDAIAAQGVEPAGPWFTHHLRRPGATFDFEIGVPVAVPIVAAGRVRPGRWPALVAARTVYRGPYEGLGAAWGEFTAWIEAQGRTPRPELWEQYLAGPESGADPAGYRTELSQPLEP